MILLKVIKVKNAWLVTISFFNHGFKFQDSVYNGCHDLMLSVNISDSAIIAIKNIDCCILNIRKSAAINVLKNSLPENRGYISK